MRTYTRSFFCSIMLLNGLFSYGTNIIIHKINIESGLSSSYIKTIFSDKKGLIWFGTDTGLDSYDGLQTVSYGKRFKTPLKGAIQSVLENNDGSFWIGTEQGAFLYNKYQNRVNYLNFGTTNINVKSVVKSSSGIVFFGTDKGLYYFEPKTTGIKHISLKHKKTDSSVLAIIEDSHQQIWLGTTTQIYGLDRYGKEICKLKYPKQTESIHISLIYLNNSLYIGTNHGIDVFDTKSHQFSSLSAFERKEISALATDDKNRLFIGVDGEGLSILDMTSNSIKTFTTSNQTSNSISSNVITSLFFDKSGILWIGTLSGGVNFFSLRNNQKFTTVPFSETQYSTIRSVYFAPDGVKYIGTRNGLILLDTRNKVTNIYRPNENNGLRAKILTTIVPYPGKPGQLLIGTFGGGLSVFNTKTKSFSIFSNNKVFIKGVVYNFCTDNKNNLWIATLSGLFKYNLANKSLLKYDLYPLMGNNDIFSLYRDRSNKIWIGTKIGVCYYAPEENKFILPESCRPYKYQCSNIFEDKSRNIWICFNKGGVLKMDKQLKQKLWITTAIGLPENAPSSLIEDKTGNIWIGTQKGLFKVTPPEEIRTYSIEDGLEGQTFCPASATLDKNGNLWWTNERGLVCYNDDKNAINPVIPQVVFTDLFINGTRFSTDTLPFLEKIEERKYEITIKGKTKNNLKFRVAALNYNNIPANQYAFMLVGQDLEWSKPTTDNIVAYNNLKEGSYVLKIKASNNDGVWTPVPYEIKITISPYFYETTTFIALVIILAGGIVLYLTRFYIVRLKNKLVTQLEEMRSNESAVIRARRVSDEKGELIKETLLSYMQSQKPYLNANIKQSEVASAIGVPTYAISEVLNKQLNQNFSDFINAYRIEEIKNRVKSGDYIKFTITAIAEECGFSARSSFLRAFKKATGVTPSEYFKEKIEKNVE